MAHQTLGVARQLCFSEEELGGQPYECATWYRRRGTPATISHFSVPLEPQAWHANITHHQEEDLGVPLEFWAWHANEGTKHTNGRGTPEPGDKKKREKGWACHLMSKAWHARLHKCLKDPGSATWARRRGTPGMPMKEGVPLKELGVARH
ncbi:hypothetical protein AHAS_Ahas18G0209700 [Arachis hypogaea]